VVTPIIRDSDGVIVVVRRDRETRAAVQKLREQICPARRHDYRNLFTFAQPRRDAPSAR
jgi:succinoglycan biosynthesis transport protein ExoP